jgi:hypothetical protein
MGSYLEIKDPDRLFFIFTIRELTFQQEIHYQLMQRHLWVKLKIELRGNFVFHETDLNLKITFLNLQEVINLVQ